MFEYICLGIFLAYDTIFCCIMGYKLNKERLEKKYRNNYQLVEDNLPIIELRIERPITNLYN